MPAGDTDPFFEDMTSALLEVMPLMPHYCDIHTSIMALPREAHAACDRSSRMIGQT